MEIIFHRYNSICEPDIIAAFRALGINVIEEDTEMYQKSIQPSERIRLLCEQILSHQPAFVFSINFFPYISNVCEKLHILYVCLSVDCPVLELFSSAIRNKCNRIFLFDRHQYLQIKDGNPDCIFHLPLAVNVDRWDSVFSSILNPSDEQYDVSFVGSLYTEKSRYHDLLLSEFDRGFCDGLIEAQLKLPSLSLIEESMTPELVAAIKKADGRFHTLPDAFTDTDSYVAANYYLGMEASSLDRIRLLNVLASYTDFQTHLFTRSDASALKGVICHEGVATHTEMPFIFRQSKINLNITIRSIQTGLSQRIWDVLGCKGFLLTNYQEELPEYFEIGRDLDCYENIAECSEKVRFYLSHDDIRREIADRGYQKVKAMHTYLIRIAQMLKITFS